ncbi:MAG: NADH:ubiquinone reductase (Na(+)-transporting) subunit C [Bacteroidales bacterium]|jgi:Na+-transporting NADH:ubiquinone oxidoreductase subunit C|nr:NADH:ubiquinone reductase (Na(+)-transporting) subunit C [Bacteroidales bacterium]MCK9499394.1 NADH:ubiquinone reductase (Na(+)-transporting) subunit C [Bacteroidales bacterium]MDY0315139.1 NADH:ubiquinone reductase (Na(+)-transporting) subunit C [Bacteroidales bacterium]
MDTNSNKYTLIYSVVMVFIVAVLLTLVALSLQPRQQQNIEIEKKRNILATLNIETNAKNAEELYEKFIVEEIAVNSLGQILENIDVFNIDMKAELRKDSKDQILPVFVAKTDDGNTQYIFAMSGKGLWGVIWGYVALKEDFTTIYGAYFDHASETPGLGAEIATKTYQNQFKDKVIFNENGDFVSIKVIKGGAGDNPSAVDAVSGGTITSNGLSDMLNTCLSAYLNFINENKNN